MENELRKAIEEWVEYQIGAKQGIRKEIPT